jgi:hypothetical protein
MTAEWQDYALYLPDDELTLSGNLPVHPRRYFRILKHLTFKSKNKNDYQIVDFGLFDKIRDQMGYSPGFFIPFEINVIYQINLSGDASFRTHHIYSLTKHEIARTIKPGRLVCILRDKNLFGIFQGVTTKRQYVILFNNTNSSMLFQCLPINYTMKELQKMFNVLFGVMTVSDVHNL